MRNVIAGREVRHPRLTSSWIGWGLVPFLILTAGCGQRAPSVAAAAVPAAVVVETAEQRPVPLILDIVARTEAVSTVELRASVEGRLREALFEQGRMVRKGQRLFRIDPRRYQAAVDSARAAVGKAEADLELAREQQRAVNARAALSQAEANLLKADRDVERLKPLAARRAAPQRDLDAAVAMQASARAAVEDARATLRTTTVGDRVGIEQAEAALAGAQAALSAALLDLEETDIRSPLDGLIGRQDVDVGNYVGRGEPGPLATVSQLDPIRLVFSVPEAVYLRIMAKGADRAGLNDIELVLSDNSTYPRRGRFSFMERAVDPKTGTLAVEARFPNPQGRLLPGMFGRVRLAVETRPDAVLVPEPAVFDAQGSKALYVVGQDGKAALRSVVTEGSYQGRSVVTSGLKGGEAVVVEGILKIRPGMPVAPRKAVQPAAADGTGRP